MVTLSHLKVQLHSLFFLAQKDSLSIRVRHRTRVYIMTIQPTNDKYKIQNWARRPRLKDKKGNLALETAECQQCGHIVIASICINKKCVTNAKTP